MRHLRSRLHGGNPSPTGTSRRNVAPTLLVAVDASSLIGLAKADAFELLRGLFERVAVTRIVHDEVQARPDRPGAVELQSAIDAGWVSMAEVAPDSDAFPDLDAGESSTLALAMRHSGPCLVVMDERLGRAHAERLQLPHIGVAGLLLNAKGACLVDAVAPFLATLERSGFRLSRRLVRAVLHQAGERA